MVALAQTFRPDEVEDDSFEALPAGTFMLQVIESSMTRNKNDDGDILLLVIEVVDGPFQKRRIYCRLNYTNPSAQAQQISRRLLKQISSSVGIEELNDTDDLNFKPFMGTVTVRKQEGYEPSNNVTRAKPLNAAANASTQRGPARPGVPATNNAPGAARPGAGARPGAAAGPAGRPWGARQPATNVDEEIPF